MNQMMLLDQMRRVFNDEGVRDLCFALDIDYDDLRPGGKRAKIRELILHCERTGRLSQLITACGNLHPNAAWPEPEMVFSRQQLVGEARQGPETITTAVSHLWQQYGETAVHQPATAKINEIDWSHGLEKYYDSLYQRVGFVQILGRRGSEPLENVFTHVNVLDKVSADQWYGIERLIEEFKPRDFGRHKRVTRMSGEAAVAQFSKLFILGKPGAGKTTFLKHTALRAIRHEVRKVPIFVSLKELSDSGKGIVDFIVHQFGVHRFPNPAPFVENLLKDGEGLLLFDGLDEVNLAGERRAKLIRQLNDFVFQYGDCPILLTCRVAATDYSFTQFDYVEMADFDTAQMGRYIDRWFAEDQVKRENCRQALLEEKGNETVRELAQVPLLLSLLCLVYEARNGFPPNRDEIYEEAMRALLFRWDARRDIRRDTIYEQLSLKHKLRLLSHVAATTFEQGEYFLREKRVVGLLETALASVPGLEEPNGERVLWEMEAQHGIFVERARQIHSFSHLTLQEYFTARYIVDNEARGMLPKLMEHVGDERWREVFLLTAGMLDEATAFCQLFVLSMEAMVSDEAEIGHLLYWIVGKSRKSEAAIKQPALRAFYFYIYARASAFTRGRDFASAFYLANDLDLDFAQARDLARAGDLARAIDRTRDLDYDLALASALTHAFDYARTMRNLIELSQRLNLTALQQALEGLTVPTSDSSFLERQQFVEQLRKITIAHRDIGHKWPLSIKQTRLLVGYLEANRLFVECLKLATVDKGAREGFENRLLLPPGMEGA